MKGDRVEIVVTADDGSRVYEIAATRAGRRVEISTGRGIVEVTEVTRTGEPVRAARFMASRVVAPVEHPANEERAERTQPQQPPASRSAGRQDLDARPRSHRERSNSSATARTSRAWSMRGI